MCVMRVCVCDEGVCVCIRRMWKVERSGEKEDRVLVMWLKKLTESEGVWASLA